MVSLSLEELPPGGPIPPPTHTPRGPSCTHRPTGRLCGACTTHPVTPPALPARRLLGKHTTSSSPSWLSAHPAGPLHMLFLCLEGPRCPHTDYSLPANSCAFSKTQREGHLLQEAPPACVRNHSSAPTHPPRLAQPTLPAPSTSRVKWLPPGTLHQRGSSRTFISVFAEQGSAVLTNELTNP